MNTRTRARRIRWGRQPTPLDIVLQQAAAITVWRTIIRRQDRAVAAVAAAVDWSETSPREQAEAYRVRFVSGAVRDILQSIPLLPDAMTAAGYDGTKAADYRHLADLLESGAVVGFAPAMAGVLDTLRRRADMIDEANAR
jgi:predicted amino acid dehydrogenase